MVWRLLLDVIEISLIHLLLLVRSLQFNTVVVYQTGTLRHSYYWRQRTDVSWNQISNIDREVVLSLYIYLLNFLQLPFANWNVKKNQEDFFDYLGTKTWI